MKKNYISLPPEILNKSYERNGNINAKPINSHGLRQ